MCCKGESERDRKRERLRKTNGRDRERESVVEALFPSERLNCGKVSLPPLGDYP